MAMSRMCAVLDFCCTRDIDNGSHRDFVSPRLVVCVASAQLFLFFY